MPLPQDIRDALWRLRAAQETANGGKDAAERSQGALQVKHAAAELNEALARAHFVEEADRDKQHREERQSRAPPPGKRAEPVWASSGEGGRKTLPGGVGAGRHGSSSRASRRPDT